MIEINLNKGLTTVIDDEDYEKVKHYKWYVYAPKNSCGNKYAGTSITIDGVRKRLLMHRLLMNPDKDQLIDHADRNGLNNQRSNLRTCTKAQNCWNKKVQKNRKYKGVAKRHLIVNHKNKKGENKIYYRKPTYRAAIVCNKKNICLGEYKTEEEAAIAYNNGALKYFGEFANLNIIK